MESKKSIFNRFSNIFKSEPWYLPFPQIIQDFVVRFASEDASEKDLFKQTKKLLLRKYKEVKSNKDFAGLDAAALAKHVDAVIYEDSNILPNLAKIGDEEFLSKLFFEINEKSNSTDLKVCVVSNPKCPLEIIESALSSEQPEELRKVALLKDELSYTEKMYMVQNDVLVGKSNLELKNYFSQNLKPTVNDVPALMDLLAENALNKNEPTLLNLQYGKYLIKVSGYICALDGHYATADLVLENTVLFKEEIINNELVQTGTFKNRDSATSFLKKKFGNIPFVVQEFVVPKSELPVKEEVSIEKENVPEETTTDKKKHSSKSKKVKK